MIIHYNSLNEGKKLWQPENEREHIVISSQELLSDIGMAEIINFQKLCLCSKVTPNLKSTKAKICPTSVCLWGKYWLFRSFLHSV